MKHRHDHTATTILSTCVGAICVILTIGTSTHAQTTLILGADGQTPWDVGDGSVGQVADLTLPSVIFDTERGFEVDQTNTPGGVIEFSRSDYPGWIFPKEADTSENILEGLLDRDRGGRIFSPASGAQVRLKDEYRKLIDNDGSTALELHENSGVTILGLIIQFDFNALFAVNRIRFFPRNAAEDFPAPDLPFQNNFLKGYEIFWDDGRPERQLNGQPIWPTLEGGLNGENEQNVVDLQIPTRFIRQLRLKSLSRQPFEIAEFQVFAEGFVPEATYVSSVFDFGDPALLGNLRWLQEAIGDSLVSTALIRTRTGVDSDPVEYTRQGAQSIGLVEVGRTSAGVSLLEDVPVKVPWKRSLDIEDSDLVGIVEELDDDALTGAEALLKWTQVPFEVRQQLALTQADYNGINAVGPVRDDLTNWSPWSSPYPVSGIVESSEELNTLGLGTPILSPSPRPFFQFMIELSNDRFDAATGIGSVAFDLSSMAIADTLIGEVFPRQAEIGVQAAFTYALLSRRGSPGTSGFDRLEISTPIRVEVIESVTVETPGEATTIADFTSADLDALPVSGGGDFAVTQVNDDGFVLSLPLVAAENSLVKVNFRASVLRFGTIFSARALNSELGSIGQQVIAGNAANLGTPDLPDPDIVEPGTPVPANLTVQLPISNQLLVNVRARPSILTPDRNNINERTLIQYDITNVASPALVLVELFDLSGRRIALLHSEEQASGRYEIPWNGTDASGSLVPPGNYVFAVSLQTDTGEERVLGVAGVVY